MHVLISPCLPYATGEGVSQDKKTNVFSDSDIQNMCFRWWQSWDVEDVGSLLLQHFGSYEAPCKWIKASDLIFSKLEGEVIADFSVEMSD